MDCLNCQIEIISKTAKKFCSSSCSASYNNRGRKHNKTTKEKISNKLKGRTTSEKHRKSISGDNHPKRRGRNLPVIPKEKKCLYCDTIFKPHKFDSKFCSQICWIKFNKDNRDSFIEYRNNCKFTFNIFAYPEEFDIELIETHGIYSASNRGNNLNGVSRDHMISVKYGYENQIDSEIISHPANCKLMLHSDNSSKKINCSLTLEQLLFRIERWNEKYGAWSG